MNKARLNEIEQLCAKATPGPWAEHASFPTNRPSREVKSLPKKVPICDMVYGTESDRMFIVESRVIIPELLAALGEALNHLGALAAESPHSFAKERALKLLSNFDLIDVRCGNPHGNTCFCNYCGKP